MEYSNIILIAKDLSAFYKFTLNASKEIKSKNETKYVEFKKKKQFEIEYQANIMRIGANITLSESSCKHLLKNSYFYDDLIEYLLLISDAQHYLNINKNFIELMIEKKKKKNLKTLLSFIASIVENSTKVLIQVLSHGVDLVESFTDKVKHYINLYKFNFIYINYLFIVNGIQNI